MYNKKIDKELIKKFKEKNIKKDINSIYSEFELVKKDIKNSFSYHIIKNTLNEKISDDDIKKTAINFFNTEYKEKINEYRKRKRKEFSIKNKKKGKYVLLPFNDKIIEVPSKIGHSYLPIKILPMEELKTKYSRHKRLKVFYNKGLKCVSCDKIGKYLIAARDRGGSIHIDVYTENFKLMTVDHIKPKSKGGTYDLNNLNPMCVNCNTKKADKYEE